MGTWGPELDANDTAQDICDEFADRIAALKGTNASVKAIFQDVERRYRSDPDAVLGFAWCLYKRKVSLGPAKILLLRYVDRELNTRRFRRWSGQEERKQVLLRFQDILQGRPPRKVPRIQAKAFPKRKAAQQDDRWGYRDAKGQWVIKPQFDFADGFEDGVARVRIGFRPKPIRYGLIDTDGKFLVKPRYDEMDVFFHGVAQVQIKGKIGYVNRQGREVSPPIWDEGSPFEEGVARVRKGRKWGLLGLSRELLLKPEWDSILEWSPTSIYGDKDGKRIEIQLPKI